MAITIFEMENTFKVLEEEIRIERLNRVKEIIDIVVMNQEKKWHFFEYFVDQSVILENAPEYIYSQIKPELDSCSIVNCGYNLIITSTYAFVKVCLILAGKYSMDEFDCIIDKIYNQMFESQLINKNPNVAITNMKGYEPYLLRDIAEDFQNSVNPYGNRKAIMRRPSKYLSKLFISVEGFSKEDTGFDSISIWLYNENVRCEVKKSEYFWEYSSKVFLNDEKTELINILCKYSIFSKKSQMFTSRYIKDSKIVEAGIDFYTGTVFTTKSDATLNETYYFMIEKTQMSIEQIKKKITSNLAHTLFII